MPNEYEEVRDLMDRVIRNQRALDTQTALNASAFAELLTPHLRSVSPYRLRALKKELANFNMHTKEWKR